MYCVCLTLLFLCVSSYRSPKRSTFATFASIFYSDPSSLQRRTSYTIYTNSSPSCLNSNNPSCGPILNYCHPFNWSSYWKLRFCSINIGV